jgi:uncharacterized protein YbjT (DUF2867 family)
MRVLLCGAGGFVGRNVSARLAAAGVSVVPAVSPRRGDTGRGALTVDFCRDVDPATWRARLEGIDSVVNTVGVLRDTRRRPMLRVHQQVPIALFEACAAAGVRRVVHVSALGIQDGDTPYAQTKRAADARLVELTTQGRLDGVVLRPSVLFGPGDASTELFMNLARLPFLVLPAPVRTARVQPLRVTELAETVETLLLQQPRRNGVLELAGPRALSLADYVASLRSQNGKAPARVATLPPALTRLSVCLGDAVPVSPWGSQALALLEKDNTSDAGTLAELLGRTPTDPARFLAA